MESLGYGEFSSGLHRQTVDRRVPVDGTIEVTWRCPLKCAHCYNNLSMDDSQARKEELSFEEHCRILDEISEAGCLWLLFTGGEIFARRDFLDIYTHAKKKGLLITLFTNGTLITPDIADYLARWVPFSIEITLYGSSRETYENITRVPGSFETCLRGIRLLLERNLLPKIKTTVVTTNKHEIWNMKRFVEQDLGLEFRFDSMMNPRIDCSQDPLAFRLTPDEIVKLDFQDPALTAEWRKYVCEANGPVHSAEDRDEIYHCGGGVTSFAINPRGRMGVCILSQYDTYDLSKGTFRDGWDTFLLGVRRKKMTRMTRCVSCEIKAMCGMCPANAELEEKDPESPIDFLCEVAHLRSNALGIPVPAHGDCGYCRSSAYGT